MLKSAKGILYLLLLSIGAICGYFALLPVAFTVLIPLEIVTKWRAIYVHIVSRHYFGFAAAVIELLCNTQIFIYADTPEILDDIPVIFICNHHTRVDWMYSWSYSAMLNNFICPSFILKDSLKTLPFFGWCMQALMYIFLERKKEKDIPKIERLLRYLSTYCSNPSVFLYPEGTDLSPSNLEKSHKFAIEKKLPLLTKVLYPKHNGFKVCLEHFHRSNKKKRTFIHDLTIAYKDHNTGRRTSEVSLMTGCFPLEIHLFVERIELFEPPVDSSALEIWMRERFNLKERKLTEFDQSVSSSGVCPWRGLLRTSKEVPYLFRLYYIVILGTCSILLFTFLMYSATLRLLAILAVSSTYVLSYFTKKGYDDLEIALQNIQKH